MAKLTMKEATPSEELIAKAAKEATVTDSTGRIIKLKRPNALAQYRLVDAMGQSAENRVYLSMCIPLIYLDGIDGDPIFQPATKRELEALIQRLDDPGLLALNPGIAQHFSSDGQEVTQAKK